MIKITYKKHSDHLTIRLNDETDILLSVNVYSTDDIEKVLQSLDYFVLSLMSMRGLSDEIEYDGDELESVLLSLMHDE